MAKLFQHSFDLLPTPPVPGETPLPSIPIFHWRKPAQGTKVPIVMNARSLLALAVLVAAGCATSPTPSPLCGIKDSGGSPIPETFAGTLATTHKTRAATHVVQLNTVDTGSCPSFDRVVFDFDGLRLPPAYTIEYVNGPVTQCGSGQPVSLAGNAILKITFDTTQAHTEAGQATATPRNRLLNLPNLKQLVVTCDFEGKVEVALGLNIKRPYRAVELLNDSKLVIDVKH